MELLFGGKKSRFPLANWAPPSAAFPKPADYPYRPNRYRDTRERPPPPFVREHRRATVRSQHDHPLQPGLPPEAVEAVVLHVLQDRALYGHGSFYKLFLWSVRNVRQTK